MTVEEGEAPASCTVRRAHAEEWQSIRELRLEALRDPIAHLAYLERLEDALQRPDSYWREQAQTAAAGTSVGKFVAVGEHAEFVGTVTALVTAPGEPDYIGETSAHVRAAIVGVYVRPDQRGGGVLQALLSETEAWLQDIGVQQVRLHVNEDNVRAQGAYRKCGYVDTGTRVEMVDGVNHEMVRELRATQSERGLDEQTTA
ncbi:GNAT family N-acetyltransferase [Nocardioides panzhihuensis]|uniref:Ribosomal protein S18 acetylase RimI-like enzyme n=1 Tax=Nocardioides panzhihuensis TaxID=860243 RepID=A0A7Z0DKG5_9ACTN|nr:GNAT family N-acetyltransferase [Nocardioides panzhihuensis]NYI76906.1 ribosomal protein S18 acetylase RimI-like enzyme [Nocardioides panzhihuensis]